MSFLGKARPKARQKNLPLLALKDLLIFPGATSPFFAGKEPSLKGLEAALAEEKEIFLVPQKSPAENPREEDLHRLGVVARVLQTIRLPDGSIRVLAEGIQRARLVKVTPRPEYIRADLDLLQEDPAPQPEIAALIQTVLNGFLVFKDQGNKVPKERIHQILGAERADTLVDLIVPYLNLPDEKKLDFFLEDRTKIRLENLAVALELENQMTVLQNDIQKKVKGRMEQSQKEYYLNEQLKEIYKELGQDEGDPTGAQELTRKLGALELPQDIREKGLKEAKRLARLGPTTPEAAILRTYLEWLTDLPWGPAPPRSRPNLSEAQAILDEDHYDMARAKERILDFIAVNQIRDKARGPILCLAGPPGTGKTSLGRSIARALGRDFVRISLGGVRDEAEIRGHRKTYVGALPGKILQGMKRAGSVNPVFLLDEIDKMTSDVRGDPGAALLEVLDPEQNHSFADHYLEVPYDLSRVMFVTTANSLHAIPRPLLDRLEVIEVPGYTDWEKIQIATRFLLPKQLEENGLPAGTLDLPQDTLSALIHGYTQESGVRNLEREVAALVRKTARKLLEAGSSPEDLTANPPSPRILAPEDLRDLLGPPRLKDQGPWLERRPGLATGLAWTEIGGKVLPVEVNLFPGKGELLLTGSLGDVMKESARIAWSLVKSRAQAWDLNPEAWTEKDLHIHFPEGAIPKDGPSAGTALCAALVSALRGQPLRPSLAMTGEVTLTGRVLAIGGLKEKLLAAYRHEIRLILLPEANRRDEEELPEEIRSVLQFHYIDTVDQALGVWFEKELP